MHYVIIVKPEGQETEKLLDGLENGKVQLKDVDKKTENTFDSIVECEAYIDKLDMYDHGLIRYRIAERD